MLNDKHFAVSNVPPVFNGWGRSSSLSFDGHVFHEADFVIQISLIIKILGKSETNFKLPSFSEFDS